MRLKAYGTLFVVHLVAFITMLTIPALRSDSAAKIVLILSVITWATVGAIDAYFAFRLRRIMQFCSTERGRRMTLGIMRQMMRKFWVWPLERLMP